MQRIQRTFADRCVSLLVPLARYRCSAFLCGWEGLVRRGAPGTESGLRRGSYLPSQVLEPSRRAATETSLHRSHHGSHTGPQPDLSA